MGIRNSAYDAADQLETMRLLDSLPKELRVEILRLYCTKCGAKSGDCGGCGFCYCCSEK